MRAYLVSIGFGKVGDAGVTGRELVIATAINAATVDVQDAERIADAIEEMGYVCVPRVPTKEMIEASWAAALAENAREVWETMIGVSDGTVTVEGIPR